ncbi:MAG: TIGR00725 family protein [Candidatus Micrarchaeota archaeon]
MRKIIVGVMGPGKNASKKDIDNSFQLGRLIARKGWILLSGGRNEGVMDAVNKGARESNGLTIGIMPTSDPKTFSESVDIAIITDMKSARNNINVLSSNIVIACGMGVGTASEVALALKANKKVILLTDDEDAKRFFSKIGNGRVYLASTPTEAVILAEQAVVSQIHE